MTIGQRIAQKRKEMGLSQEALGEKLGVSRQSIYKWESDGALPEIDKLITLSRLFGLSVGALLGVEEAQLPAAEADTAEDQEENGEAADSAPELTPSQIKIIEEIAARYIAALPKEPPRKKRRFLRFAAVCCLLFAMWELYLKLNTVDEQYRRLTDQVEYLQQNVEDQIDGISTRVENILKAQNSLMADGETSIISTDMAKGLVTFSFRAVPKTFTADTLAYLEVTNKGSTEVFGPFAPESNQTFRGEVTTALTNDIVLSIVFESGGVRSTELLKEYSYLYSDTLPEMNVHGSFWRNKLQTPYTLTFPSPDGSHIVYTRNYSAGKAFSKSEPSAEFTDIRVGLFKNRTLVTWAFPIPKPANYYGFENASFYQFPNLTLPLTDEDTICVAAVATDQYGRTTVFQDGLFRTMENGTMLNWPENHYTTSSDPDDWIYK